MKLKLPAPLTYVKLPKGFFRPLEYAALGIILLAIAAGSYLFFDVLTERKDKVNELKSQVARIDAQIANEKRLRNKDISTLLNNRVKAIDNLKQFNEGFLEDPQKGRIVLINEINKLVKKNNLKLAGAINFKYTEEANLNDEKGQNVRRNEQNKLSLYPSITSTFAVAGDYENFRNFLYDIESNELFLIVETLNLQSNNSKDAAPGSSRRQTQLVAEEGVLIVQMDVKAYFRKQFNAAN